MDPTAGRQDARSPVVEEVPGTGPHGSVTQEDVRQAARRRAFDGRHQPRIMVSPLARRLAGELGVDLGTVAGSGPDGVITRADVEHAATGARSAASGAATADDAPGPGDATTADDGRRRGASDTSAAHGSEIAVAHHRLGTTIDLTAALGWLEERNRGTEADRLVPSALLCKAAALAAHRVPEVNGHLRDGGFRPSESVHLGVTIPLGGGRSITPAIRDADRLPLDDLAAALRDLVGRSRTGRLRRSETSDPTITVADLGDGGAEEVFPAVHAPQVAVVGFGRIIERPVARGGLLGVAPVVRATLVADHRASDAHGGGLYLGAVDLLLQDPAAL